jgi:hypothetical protein
VVEEDAWVRGFVPTPGDVDYFAFTLAAGATYEDDPTLGNSARTRTSDVWDEVTPSNGAADLSRSPCEALSMGSPVIKSLPQKQERINQRTW